MFYRLFASVLVAISLSACQSLPKSSDSQSVWLDDGDYFSARSKQVDSLVSWRYSAKVGLNTPLVKEQANLVWEFIDQANNVRLFGPLGAGAVKLQFDEYGVELSDNKGLLHRGDSAEDLLTRIVGWPIPIDALTSWIFVMPAQNAVFRYQLDENQQVTLLEQLGWTIEYSTYRDYDGRLMPRKIVATKQVAGSVNDQNGKAVVVKLVTKSWRE